MDFNLHLGLLGGGGTKLVIFTIENMKSDQLSKMFTYNEIVHAYSN